jgi:hypothetical protein
VVVTAAFDQDVLWFAGSGQNTDTNLVGYSKTLNSLVYPTKFVQGYIETVISAPSTGILVGGEFFVEDNVTFVKYSNLVAFDGVNYLPPASNCPLGLSTLIMTMKKSNYTDEIFIGGLGSPEDSTLTYYKLGSVLDTVVTDFRPSSFMETWSISSFEFYSEQILIMAVHVSDTGDRTYIAISVISGEVVAPHQFDNARIMNLTKSQGRLWFQLVFSPTQWQESYKITSIYDQTTPGINPEFKDLIGVGGIGHLIENSDKELLVVGAFKYQLTADTAINSLVIYVVDTIPPVLLLTEQDTISFQLGTPSSFFEYWRTEGYQVSDNIDGDISDSVRITGFVDTSQVGCYILTYTVTDQAGLSDTGYRTFCVTDTVTGIQGIQGIQNFYGISVFPNPAKDNVSILSAESAKMYLYESSGRLVWTQDIETGINTVSLNLSSLSPGIHMVLVSKENRTALKKIFIE